MRLFRWSCLALLLVGNGLAFGAQSEVEIQQKSIECWPIDQFLLIQSSFVPPEDIQTAKFYFRDTSQPDYYYIELTLGQSGGRAIAPKAHPDTAEVTFYTELVTHSYSAFRTEERTVPVASGDECQRRDPETAFYTGQNPDIAVGATRLGSTPFPPGFQAEGISRVLSATGITGEAGGGGGIGGKTIGILAGIGGAGAAAFALSGGGGSEATTSAIGGITTSSPFSSSTSTAIGAVTSTTTTAGGGGSSTSSATTTVFGGSTTTVFGSTTTIFGSSTTTVFGSSTTTVIGSSTTTSVGTSSSTTSIGTSTTTIGSSTTTVGTSSTTSSPTTTTSVSSTSAPSTSTTTRPPSGADMRLDSISDNPDPVVSGKVVVYTIRVTNLGPNTAPRVLISLSMAQSDRVLGGDCTGGFGFGQCSIGPLDAGKSATVMASLQLNGAGPPPHTINASVGGGTADPNLGNNQDSESTGVTANQRTSDEGARVLDLLSTLDVRPIDGRIRARITVNDAASEETSNTGNRPHAFRAQQGENRVAAQVQIGESDSGTWRLDFGTTRNFVPGSLRAHSGRVLSQDASSITFALDGETNDLRFTLDLSESTH